MSSSVQRNRGDPMGRDNRLRELLQKEKHEVDEFCFYRLMQRPKLTDCM